MSELRQLTMRVSLSGLAANAADVLETLAADLRDRAGYDADSDDRDDPARDADQYVFMLRELSKHARQTAAGLHSVEMFAGFYGLAKPAGEGNADG